MVASTSKMVFCRRTIGTSRKKMRVRSRKMVASRRNMDFCERTIGASRSKMGGSRSS